jgi:hypothetical protein
VDIGQPSTIVGFQTNRVGASRQTAVFNNASALKEVVAGGGCPANGSSQGFQETYTEVGSIGMAIFNLLAAQPRAHAFKARAGQIELVGRLLAERADPWLMESRRLTELPTASARLDRHLDRVYEIVGALAR